MRHSAGVKKSRLCFKFGKQGGFGNTDIRTIISQGSAGRGDPEYDTAMACAVSECLESA